jgi:hypothetical protein
MRQNRVGVPVEADSNEQSTFVLKIEKRDHFAVFTNSEGMFLTARSETVAAFDFTQCSRSCFARCDAQQGADVDNAGCKLEQFDVVGIESSAEFIGA